MMISDIEYNYSYFDSLILLDKSFAVYRLPGCDTMTFAMQQERTPEYLLQISELNGMDGFVIAPFVASEKTPIVILHPDIILEGEKRILTFLKRETEASACKPDLIPLMAYSPTNPYSIYKKAFKQFKTVLRLNTCKKIVLSRISERKKPLGFSAGKTFKAACEAYPEAFVYLCHTPKTGTWFGSSPELLLSGEKTNWHTVALAGTRKISTKEEQTQWDDKNIREQYIVTDYLGKQLHSHQLDYTINGPYTTRAGQLMHLKSEFSFRMENSDKIGDLLESLHPTPAVCGFPKDKAYQLILDNEGYDRKYYSGFIGQISMKGKTDLFVNLRCMQIKPDILTLFAGGGLLPSSELESEWEETEEKLQTMLSLIDFKND